MNVTFLNLLEAFEKMSLQVDKIERLLTSKKEEPTEKLLTIEEAAAFLDLSKPTLYGYVHRRQIPFLKKSKRLYFVENELLEWVKDSRKETIAEVVLQIGKSKKEVEK